MPTTNSAKNNKSDEKTSNKKNNQPSCGRKCVEGIEVSAAILCYIPSGLLLCCHMSGGDGTALGCCIPNYECGDVCCDPRQRCVTDFFCRPNKTIGRYFSTPVTVNATSPLLPADQENTAAAPPPKQSMS